MSTITVIRKQEADRRRQRLAELIRIHFSDKQSDFVARVDGNQGEISALIGNQRKSFGAVKARNLEEQAGLLKGSLDAEPGEPFFAYQIEASAKEPRSGRKAPVIGMSAKATQSRLVEESLPQPTEEEFAFVPQLDIAAACGEGRFQDHVVVKGGLAFKRSSLRDFGVPEEAARIIYAAGGSMLPTIQDGCVVLVNTADRSPLDGKVYLICKPDGGLVLKRLIRDYHPSVGGQAWIMRSDNPDKIAHPDKVLPPDDRTMIAGRAVWNDNRL
ncbi:S24 family peptidase [Paraburkholderia tropica]|uniref:S24 family peptidase n=1 Tax=Paraburkholderia tropica TaxID=92647 RepID=UPI0015906DC7|nr:S24 family peptidase [Paraburkholderia tropica]